MTPQRGENFHRGLSNQIYLFCTNCSDAWRAITIHRVPISVEMMKCVVSTWTVYGILYFGTGKCKKNKIIVRQWSHDLPFFPHVSWLSSWVVIRSLLSACFSQITPLRRATTTWHYTVLLACHLEDVGNSSGRLGVRGGVLPSCRPYPMYSHRSGQMSGKSESLKRSRKKTGPALASSCSCFQKSIGYPVTARRNYIFDSLQLKRARTPAWRSVWFGRSDPSIQFLLFLLHPWH